MQQILSRIRTGTDSLLRAIEPSTTRGGFGNRSQQSELGYLVNDLAEAALHLDDHIARRETTRTDVEDVLRRGVLVDEAIGRDATSNARNTWATIRRDLDSLATAYDLGFNWQNPTYRGDPDPGIYARWSGPPGRSRTGPGHARELRRAAPQATAIAILGPGEAPLALVGGRHRFRLLMQGER